MASFQTRPVLDSASPSAYFDQPEQRELPARIIAREGLHRIIASPAPMHPEASAMASAPASAVTWTIIKSPQQRRLPPALSSPEELLGTSPSADNAAHARRHLPQSRPQHRLLDRDRYSRPEELSAMLEMALASAEGLAVLDPALADAGAGSSELQSVIDSPQPQSAHASLRKPSVQFLQPPPLQRAASDPARKMEPRLTRPALKHGRDLESSISKYGKKASAEKADKGAVANQPSLRRVLSAGIAVKREFSARSLWKRDAAGLTRDDTVRWLAKRAARSSKLSAEEELDELARVTPMWKDDAHRSAAYKAAHTFDIRQGALKYSTYGSWKLCSTRPHDVSNKDNFRISIKELFRHRYFVAEKTAVEETRVNDGTWRLEDSIWQGRQFRAGEDRGFYDADSVKRRAIHCDFGKALAKGKLLPYMLKHDADSPCPETQPDMVQAFQSEIKEVLVANARMLYMVFDYYASVGVSGDIFHISKLGYDTMVQDLGIKIQGSQHCDTRHLDRIFFLVNTSSEEHEAALSRMMQSSRRLATRSSRRHDSKDALTRAELVQCLVRIAIARYILTPKTLKTPKGGQTDVAEALEELFRTIKAKASPEVLQNGYHFRSRSCYTEETDLALRTHEDVLRLLYTKYSARRGDTGRKDDGRLVAQTDKMLSPGQWLCMCRELSLLSNDLTAAQARLIFMWSRMRVIDEDDPKKRERIENLTWWGFLEAIVRVAQAKAIPTDDEVKSSGCTDAAEFLISLKRDDPAMYSKFLSENRRGWWEPTRQKIHKKVSVVLMLMLHSLVDNLQRWQANDSRIALSDDLDQITQAVSARAHGDNDQKNKAKSGRDQVSKLLSKISSALELQSTTVNEATVVIQKHARGFRTRRSTAKLRMEELVAANKIQGGFRNFLKRHQARKQAARDGAKKKKKRRPHAHEKDMRLRRITGR